MWTIDCPCRTRGETRSSCKFQGLQIAAFPGLLPHDKAVLVSRRGAIIGFFIIATGFAIAGITDVRWFRSNVAGYHGILLTDSSTIPLNTILAIFGAGTGRAEPSEEAVLNVMTILVQSSAEGKTFFNRFFVPFHFSCSSRRMPGNQGPDFLERHPVGQRLCDDFSFFKGQMSGYCS